MKQLIRFFRNVPEIKLSLIAWLVSIVLFFGEVVMFHEVISFTVRLIVFTTILFGIGSFILLLASLLFYPLKRKLHFYKHLRLSIIFSLLLIILLASTGVSFGIIANIDKTVSQAPTTNNLSNPTATPEPTTTYVPYLPVTATPKELDTDMVTCKSTVCGQTLITRAECKVAVCCEVGNGWYWYSSGSRCDDTQYAYWKTYYDILYGNTSVQTYIPPLVPIQSDYSTDYASLLDNFNKQNAADATNVQKQLDTMYSGTMQNINNDINGVKASLTPAAIQYKTWGDYYADHPHEIMQHNPSDPFGQ